jgi:glucose/arabinose dehydrogenase
MTRVAVRFAVCFSVSLVSVSAPVDRASAGTVGEEPVVQCRRPPACWITAFAFTQDGGEIFYVERFTGEIRRFTLASGRDERWARLGGVASGGERGVLGIALDPDWESDPDQHQVYVYYSRSHTDRNSIVRLNKVPGRDHRKELLAIPGSIRHNGGALHFGPDGRLYAVTGDAGVPSWAQRARNLAGKVLRMTERGGRPKSNPTASRAYSRGHRNSFGFTWDPETGRLWQTENGPECDDEINLVLPGRNYGWGAASTCPGTSESGPSPVGPAFRINPVVAPTGGAFCAGCGLGDGVEGRLLVGSFNEELIYAFDLNADRDDIAGRTVLLRRRDAVLAVEAAPDGTVYFSDVRGIYRIS